MTEILEYALVFGISTLVIGFSLGIYSFFSNTLVYSEERATFSSIETVALNSMGQGRAAVTLDFNHATVSCSGDELSFSSPSYSSSFDFPSSCILPPQKLTGMHTLVFSSSANSVIVVVD
jgi:hypothetical protein